MVARLVQQASGAVSGSTAMTNHALAELEFSDKTAKRAQYEGFEFSIEGPGRVRVTNASYGAEKDDHTYTVTVTDGVPVSCGCPCDEHRGGACKHRVAVAIRGPIMDAAAGTPARADGGQLLEDETQGESGEDTPACLCEIDPDGLGCFEHYEVSDR